MASGQEKGAERLETGRSAAAKFMRAGVMGWPVMHSRSPKLHTYWLEEYGIAGSYEPLPVEPNELEAALRALPARGFAGCNLTIPHKEAAMRILDRVDPLAKRVGAVNTVVVAKDGTLDGTNTDVFGYGESVREAAPSWRADRGPIVVLGAGGGARSVLLSLVEAGAREIRLVNRTLARAEALAREFGAPIKAHSWSDREAALDGAAMLVNTTSQGMVGETALPIALDRLRVNAIVSDIIYIPKETPLLAAARARGNRTVNGLGMLLHQARPAFRAWTGVMPDVTPELRGLIEADLG